MGRFIKPHKKSLTLVELIAIAIGGMVGGGIFSILGEAASLIGFLTPLAIVLGGGLALLAGYSYVKLALYYRDEGATYSFFKRTFRTHLAASVIGWLTIFGYISTLALYSYTFSSYAISGTAAAHNIWVRKLGAWLILGVFCLINVWSVKGMGKIEDLMVYSKVAILVFISYVLIRHGNIQIPAFFQLMGEELHHTGWLLILIVSSITFVGYEGFQLVINGIHEAVNPDRNIPRAIYWSIFIVMGVYVVLATAALSAIPIEEIVRNKEYALAAGTQQVLGMTGYFLIVLGAILATSSAISSTLFGASRQMAVIAEDGYFPAYLKKRDRKNIPVHAIVTMTGMAAFMVLIGGLELILEFGSITFLFVSALMAYANFRIRKKTHSSGMWPVLALVGLTIGIVFILYYEITHKLDQMMVILVLYALLAIGALLYAYWAEHRQKHRLGDASDKEGR